MKASAHPLWAKLKLLRTLMSVSGQMLLLRLFLAALCPAADEGVSCGALLAVTACRR